MFYEGSEKRLEITSTVNLLEIDNNFWKRVVSEAGAYIISQIENTEVKAFLLSESSLFIWKHRLLLITCGETQLVKAALYFQKKIARKDICSLLFQRHQSHYPERQKSSFQQDSLLLQKHLKGDSQHWNKDYCGDIFLFGNNQQSNATRNILMLHGLNGDFFEQLQMGQVATQQIASRLQLIKYFKGFIIDQYSFDPKGYSLNAIHKELYFTIHITPEKLSSYISFESNLPTANIRLFERHLIALFMPQRCYLMQFTQNQQQLSILTTSTKPD